MAKEKKGGCGYGGTDKNTIAKASESKNACIYCGNPKYYLYHTKDAIIEWAVCFDCFRKAMDNGLGKK